jgi:hypothetical protein
MTSVGSNSFQPLPGEDPAVVQKTSGAAVNKQQFDIDLMLAGVDVEQTVPASPQNPTQAKATACAAKNVAIGGGQRLELPSTPASSSRASSASPLKRASQTFTEASKRQTHVDFKENERLNDSPNSPKLNTLKQKLDEKTSRLAGLATIMSNSTGDVKQRISVELSQVRTQTGLLKTYYMQEMKKADTYIAGLELLQSLMHDFDPTVSEEINLERFEETVSSMDSGHPEKTEKEFALKLIKDAFQGSDTAENLSKRANGMLKASSQVSSKHEEQKKALPHLPQPFQKQQELDILPRAGKAPDQQMADSFRKFGEFHSNLNQKVIEIGSISHLSLSPATKGLVDCAVDLIQHLQQDLLTSLGDQPVRKDLHTIKPSEMNLRELDTRYAELASQLASVDLSDVKGRSDISKSMYDLRGLYTQKYAQLTDPQVLEKCCNTLQLDGSYGKLAVTLSLLVDALSHEKPAEGPSAGADVEQFNKASGRTSKNTAAAIAVSNQALGTFITNTMEILVKEMLKNTPQDAPQRGVLEGSHAFIRQINSTLG